MKNSILVISGFIFSVSIVGMAENGLAESAGKSITEAFIEDPGSAFLSQPSEKRVEAGVLWVLRFDDIGLRDEGKGYENEFSCYALFFPDPDRRNSLRIKEVKPVRISFWTSSRDAEIENDIREICKGKHGGCFGFYPDGTDPFVSKLDIKVEVYSPKKYNRRIRQLYREEPRKASLAIPFPKYTCLGLARRDMPLWVESGWAIPKEAIEAGHGPVADHFFILVNPRGRVLAVKTGKKWKHPEKIITDSFSEILLKERYKAPGRYTVKTVVMNLRGADEAPSSKKD